MILGGNLTIEYIGNDGVKRAAHQAFANHDDIFGRMTAFQVYLFHVVKIDPENITKITFIPIRTD